MIRSRFASALALAAFLAAPAFAQTDSNSSTVNGATVAPLEKNAAKQSAASKTKQAKADSKVSSTTSGQADVSTATRTTDGAYVAPLEKNAANQSSSSTAKQAKADSKVSTTASGQADVSTATRKTDGAYVAPLEKNAANQQAKANANCEDHPQAGKLADKSTGEAKEHSASPVHMDCAPTVKAKAKTAKKKIKTAASETK